MLLGFLWERGLDWDEVSEDDIEDVEDGRRRGAANLVLVDGGMRAREQAALKLLCGIAAQRGLVPSNPVTLASASDVKWLSPRGLSAVAPRRGQRHAACGFAFR